MHVFHHLTASVCATDSRSCYRRNWFTDREIITAKFNTGRKASGCCMTLLDYEEPRNNFAPDRQLPSAGSSHTGTAVVAHFVLADIPNATFDIIAFFATLRTSNIPCSCESGKNGNTDMFVPLSQGKIVSQQGTFS